MIDLNKSETICLNWRHRANQREGRRREPETANTDDPDAAERKNNIYKNKRERERASERARERERERARRRMDGRSSGPERTTVNPK